MGRLKRIFGVCQEPKCFKKGRRCFSDHPAASKSGQGKRSSSSEHRYCLLHASCNGYCVICGVLATQPDPFREEAQMVICRDCSLKREIWRRQGPAPG